MPEAAVQRACQGQEGAVKIDPNPNPTAFHPLRLTCTCVCKVADRGGPFVGRARRDEEIRAAQRGGDGEREGEKELHFCKCGVRSLLGHRFTSVAEERRKGEGGQLGEQLQTTRGLFCSAQRLQ